MSSKHLVYLLVVAIIVVAAGVIISQREMRSWESSSTGDKLFADFPAEKIAEIRISTSDEEVTLKEKTGTWRVAERFDYPAAWDSLQSLVESISDLTIKRAIEPAEKANSRLHLFALSQAEEEPSELLGKKIAFYDKKGNNLKTLILGKKYKTSEAARGARGRFVRVPQTNKIALVDKSFRSAHATPSEWLDDKFIEVKNVKHAKKFVNEELQWQLSRKEKSGDLSLQGDIPEGHELADSKISNVANALSYIDFQDVVDREGISPEKSGLEQPERYVFKDFDGVKTTLLIGNQTDSGHYYTKLETTYEMSRASSEEGQESSSEKGESAQKKEETDSSDIKEKTQQLNKRLSGWIYLLASDALKDLRVSRDELFKKEKEEKESSETRKSMKQKKGQIPTPPQPPTNPKK